MVLSEQIPPTITNSSIDDTACISKTKIYHVNPVMRSPVWVTRVVT